MKLGILLRTESGTGLDMNLVLECERLGYDSAWTGEAYGGDAVTPIAWMPSSKASLSSHGGSTSCGRSATSRAVSAWRSRTSTTSTRRRWWR